MMSHSFSRWTMLILLSTLTLTLTACNNSGRFPIEGEVSLDGTMVDQGGIAFIPQEGVDSTKISGRIVDGRYQIPAEKGPALGKYKVIIFWDKKTGGTYVDGDSGDVYDERKEGMPNVYRDQKTTPLEVEFVKGQKVYDLIITSDTESP